MVQYRFCRVFLYFVLNPLHFEVTDVCSQATLYPIKSLPCLWPWGMMTQEFPDIFMFLCTGFRGGYFYSLAFFHVSSIVALLFCDFARVFPLRETNDQVGGKKQ